MDADGIEKMFIFFDDYMTATREEEILLTFIMRDLEPVSVCYNKETKIYCSNHTLIISDAPLTQDNVVIYTWDLGQILQITNGELPDDDVIAED